MTVAELLASLKDLDPQSEVWLSTYCDIGESALLHRVKIHSLPDASIHEPGVVLLLDDTRRE